MNGWDEAKIVSGPSENLKTRLVILSLEKNETTRPAPSLKGKARVWALGFVLMAPSSAVSV